MHESFWGQSQLSQKRRQLMARHFGSALTIRLMACDVANNQLLRTPMSFNSNNKTMLQMWWKSLLKTNNLLTKNHRSYNKNISDNSPYAWKSLIPKFYSKNINQHSSKYQLRKQNIKWSKTLWHDELHSHHFFPSFGACPRLGQHHRKGIKLWEIKADCCVCSSHSFAFCIVWLFDEELSHFVSSVYCHVIQIKSIASPNTGSLLYPAPLMLDAANLAWQIF